MATPVRVETAGGEYMETVVVVEWAVEPGAPVTAGETLVVVETAKAATEIPSPANGFLTAIYAEPGTEVPLSSILGLVGSSEGDTVFETEMEPAATLAEPPSGHRETTKAVAAVSGDRIIASPAARHRAVSMGIDLQVIRASSPTGRIKLRDLPVVQIDPGRSQMPALTDRFLPPDDVGPLNVLRSGPREGTPVLMIHGFGADALSWSLIERDLARHRPVIRLEMPNHGRSPRRRILNFANLAREIRSAFDELQLETVHLLGHSLGGACALALADIRPGRIASLTLIAPGGLGPKIDGDFIEGLASASCPESLGPWLRHMVADSKLIGDDFVRAAMASRGEPALRSAQRQMARDLFPDSTQAFDLRAALGRLECPTRIIWGRADTIVPWEQVVAAPGRIALHLFAATGHVPQLEQPDAVATILREQIANAEAQR